MLVGLVALAAAVLAPAALAQASRVDGYKPETRTLRVLKPSGALKRVKLARQAAVKLRDASGVTTRANLNELVDGAKILGLRDPDDDGVVEKVVLKELASGSADCSFDQSDEDGDGDESWDCSLDYESDHSSESQDVSFDESSSAWGPDSDKDVSWDASYSYSDDQSELDWDCSFSASESRSDGSLDGDASFDCSWDSSEALESPLWTCDFKVGRFAFLCKAPSLDGMSFGYEFDLSDVDFAAFLDQQADYVKEADEDEGSVACSAEGGGAYSCSFDTSLEAGDCDADWSYDESHTAFGGDLSGDFSFSCSTGSRDDL